MARGQGHIDSFAATSASRQPRSARALHILLIILFFCFVFALLFARAMNRGLAHDEYHYVAGGKLLADEFAIPYVDYPYIHFTKNPSKAQKFRDL